MSSESNQEEKWWLKRRLSDEERELILLPDNKHLRAERKAERVHWRLQEHEKALTDARRTRILKWFDQWVRGEAFREMSYDDEKGPPYSLKSWLRQQFVAAAQEAFTGRNLQSQIDVIIRQEVGKALYGDRRMSGGNQERIQEYVNKIVKEEVKKQVMAALDVDVRVSGRVFSKPAGERLVDLGGDDLDDE